MKSTGSPLLYITSFEHGDVITLGIRTSSDELRQIFKFTTISQSVSQFLRQLSALLKIMTTRTTSTILRPLYWTTGVRQHPELRTGAFCWCKVFNPVYTIQPFVKPVVQPVWQPAVSCKQTSNRLWTGCQTWPCWTNSHCSFNRLYNRIDNRLYTRYNRLSNWFDNWLYRVYKLLTVWQ